VFLAFVAADAAWKLASIGAMLGGAVAGVLLLAMNRAPSDGRQPVPTPAPPPGLVV